VHGDKWTVLEGALSGQTQTAEVDRSEDAGGDLVAFITGDMFSQAWGASTVVWEHPLDAQFACASLSGWPQLVVTLWQQDEYQRNEIIGYGMVQIPVSPGLHRVEIATWRPEGTWLQELKSSFLGGSLPQLTDSTLVFNPALLPRYSLCTATSATVDLELNIMARGFEKIALSA